jgi:hypothetical protein
MLLYRLMCGKALNYRLRCSTSDAAMLPAMRGAAALLFEGGYAPMSHKLTTHQDDESRETNPLARG